MQTASRHHSVTGKTRTSEQRKAIGSFGGFPVNGWDLHPMESRQPNWQALAAMNNNDIPELQVRQQASHDEISRRAAELWRQYGSPEGRDEEIWLEAERQLRGNVLDQTNRTQAAPAREGVGGQHQLGVPPIQGAPVSVAHQPSHTEFMEKPKPGPAAKGRGKPKK